MQSQLRVSTAFQCLVLVLLFYGLSLKVMAMQTIELGTATKGGGFELFGKTLAEVVNASKSPVNIKIFPTKGSKQNLEFLDEGKIKIGLVEGNAARQALLGIGRKKLDLKVLSVMYPNPGMFVVRADSSYQNILDLKGKPIAFGTRASGLRILANDVLSGIALDPDRDFQQVILDKAADGPALVLNKKVEALWGAGIGWPGFVKIANSPAGARFIPPTESQITKILSKHPHLRRMSVPAGTYNGQEKDIQSVGLWSIILISPSVSDDTAYHLAKALHQGEAKMAKRLKQGQYTTSENTIKNVSFDLLHTGVKRYYREQNIVK